MEVEAQKHDQEDGEQDDLETLLAKVADQIADLSTSEEFPRGFKGTHSSFEAKDVDFTSNAWLLRLLQVQAWLHPDEEIHIRSAEADPHKASIALFKDLGIVEPELSVELKGDIVALTAAGAEQLSGRLDTALELQKQFLESLETLTRKQATDAWIEAWEESEADEGSSEPIKAKSEVWPISDFAGKASKGILNLNPSYQRGDVWPTRDAQKLIESILRGIPLPSIILLKPKKGGSAKSSYEVVDGKQRLTSILRFIGQHPQALANVRAAAAKHPKAKLDELFRNDYKKFRRAWKTVVGEQLSDRKETEYYFPFRLAKNSSVFKGNLSALGGKYFHEIRDQEIQIGEGTETVEDVFESTCDYKIPLIEYLDASPRQIHEVFHLYNRQGKHLNAEEIRNALFHEVDLVRLVLVASGDNFAPRDLAPYLPEEVHQLLKEISATLDEYKFGVARYRRTKLLSWMYGLLFQPSIGEDGRLTVRSTAKQIDELFKAIGSSGSPHNLSKHVALTALVRDTHRCLDAHSSADCWDVQFKDDDKGKKWQELQLVASLVAVFLAGLVVDQPYELLKTRRKELLEFTAAHRRPAKTQNKTQWAFIAQVALGIVDTLGIDRAKLEKELLKHYGTSCLPTLGAARDLYVKD